MKKSTAPEWFKDFEKRNNERFDRIENRLDNIERRLDNIESCPTIKSELRK